MHNKNIFSALHHFLKVHVREVEVLSQRVVRAFTYFPGQRLPLLQDNLRATQKELALRVGVLEQILEDYKQETQREWGAYNDPYLQKLLSFMGEYNLSKMDVILLQESLEASRRFLDYYSDMSHFDVLKKNFLSMSIDLMACIFNMIGCVLMVVVACVELLVMCKNILLDLVDDRTKEKLSPGIFVLYDMPSISLYASRLDVQLSRTRSMLVRAQTPIDFLEEKIRQCTKALSPSLKTRY